MQQQQAVAVGYFSGYSNQGTNATAVGFRSGESNQGNNSVAIGAFAASNTPVGVSGNIVINASGSPLNPVVSSAFYAKPIRINPSGLSGTQYALRYDGATGEIYAVTL